MAEVNAEWACYCTFCLKCAEDIILVTDKSFLKSFRLRLTELMGTCNGVLDRESRERYMARLLSLWAVY